MKILITGANGFIGKNLADYFCSLNCFVYRGTRQNIDLMDIDNIRHIIKTHNINTIIHCAIEGGHRNTIDTPETFYKNLKIFNNLSLVIPECSTFINIASGAEFDRKKEIHYARENDIFLESPQDYYGLSKNIISRQIYKYNNSYNIRLFGCFNHNELETRFIKNSINQYIGGRPIKIHQDRTMDFVYINDLFSAVYAIIVDDIRINDINLVYSKKYKLSDIASIINSLNSYQVPIEIENLSTGLSYTGDSTNLNKSRIKINNLEYGIQQCYDYLK